ncbi:MAG: GatB/YqeY domain-containing protein [Patescibacteria group bacterium]
MLHQQLKNGIKQALLEKNPLKLGVVRGLVAACTNELVAKRRKPDDWLTDEETLAVIRRAAKQRQDSIEQFRAGDRPDLVQQETAELAQLKTYLPIALSENEIEKIVREKIAALGAETKLEAGKLIGALMKDLKNQADGAIVKKVVELILSRNAESGKR